ncbi:hypothetical protein [Sorangium sp. So ce1078]
MSTFGPRLSCGTTQPILAVMPEGVEHNEYNGLQPGEKDRFPP